LDSKDKIPFVRQIGDHQYNLWQDEKNKRGLWRRTTLEDYCKPFPTWETVLDIDELNKAENENWVYKGATVLDLGPDEPHDIVLLKLSRGGADATVIREFNLTTKSFVTNGFSIPEAKTYAGFKSRDVLYVGTDFGPGSLTDSGYPRVVKEWKRGTPLADATVVFEGEAADVAVHGYCYYDRGVTHHMFGRSVTFYTSETYMLLDGKQQKIPVPEDVEVSTFHSQFLIQNRKDWEVNGQTFLAGSVLAVPIADLMANRFDTIVALFTPTPRTSLSHNGETKNYLIMHVLDNVITKLQYWKYDFEKGQFVDEKREVTLPNMSRPSASGISPDNNDDVWITSSGFTEPTTLSLGSAVDGSMKAVKTLPAMFDASGLVVRQYEAKSKDGTMVPYFIVHREDVKLDGSNPTLLYGYGGFEISMLPSYMGTAGAGWLERGGIYVQANIRGGGEFGPTWHQAALKENRNKAYEDFIACGEDVIARKFTSTPKLGIMGGSNGGLLMGNMLVMRPDLWGAIVCQVPLLDMKRFNKLLAGASWMGEYGNPDLPEEWAFLKNYSPYHNLVKGKVYPPALFTTSTRDDRVHPGHARKMVRKLLDLGSTNTLYYENIEGGHGGAADNGQRAFMKSLEYEFLWKTLTEGPIKPL
jgi:prolyl oligopeptidase